MKPLDQAEFRRRVRAYLGTELLRNKRPAEAAAILADRMAPLFRAMREQARAMDLPARIVAVIPAVSEREIAQTVRPILGTASDANLEEIADALSSELWTLYSRQQAQAESSWRSFVATVVVDKRNSNTCSGEG